MGCHAENADIRRFFYEAGYRALITNEYFSKTFDIKYVVFNRSVIIKTASMADTTRRIDKYDKNDFYQRTVSDLFKDFTSVTDDKFSYHVCGIHSDEDVALNRFIFWLRRKADVIFDCMLTQPNKPMNTIYSNITNNIICRINTDAIYKNLFFLENDHKFIPNFYIELCDNMDDDILFENVEKINHLISKYKDRVTSFIDNEIVENVIKYLEENNDNKR